MAESDKKKLHIETVTIEQLKDVGGPFAKGKVIEILLEECDKYGGRLTHTQFEACSGIAAKHKREIVDKSMIDFSVEGVEGGGADRKEVSVPCTLADLQVSISEVS